jgi:hypothetical protein
MALDSGLLREEVNERKKEIYRKRKTPYKWDLKGDGGAFKTQYFTQTEAQQLASFLYPPCQEIKPAQLRDWTRKGMIEGPTLKRGVGRGAGIIALYSKEYAFQIAVTKKLKDLGFKEREIALSFLWAYRGERLPEVKQALEAYLGESWDGDPKLGQCVFWWTILYSLAERGVKFTEPIRFEIWWGNEEEPEKIRIVKTNTEEEILVDIKDYFDN